MPYFSLPLPQPIPDEEDAPFWTHVRNGALHFQCCGECARHTHPPALHCGACGSPQREWRRAPAIGRLFTYTIVHRASHPSVAQDIPYNVVVVEFPECDGVRLVTNAVDAQADELQIGMPLEIFIDETGGQWLPRARKVPA